MKGQRAGEKERQLESTGGKDLPYEPGQTAGHGDKKEASAKADEAMVMTKEDLDMMTFNESVIGHGTDNPEWSTSPPKSKEEHDSCGNAQPLYQNENNSQTNERTPNAMERTAPGKEKQRNGMKDHKDDKAKKGKTVKEDVKMDASQKHREKPTKTRRGGKRKHKDMLGLTRAERMSLAWLRGMAPDQRRVFLSCIPEEQQVKLARALSLEKGGADTWAEGATGALNEDLAAMSNSDEEIAEGPGQVADRVREAIERMEKKQKEQHERLKEMKKWYKRAARIRQRHHDIEAELTASSTESSTQESDSEDENGRMVWRKGKKPVDGIRRKKRTEERKREAERMKRKRYSRQRRETMHRKYGKYERPLGDGDAQHLTAAQNITTGGCAKERVGKKGHCHICAGTHMTTSDNEQPPAKHERRV